MTTDQLETLQSDIINEPRARFAIYLDRLAYAQDNHRLGSEPVRTYVRNTDVDTLTGQQARDVATFKDGLQLLTGRKKILGARYGELAVQVRDAGGSLFDLETDSWAREVTARIGAGDPELAGRIRGRAES